MLTTVAPQRSSHKDSVLSVNNGTTLTASSQKVNLNFLPNILSDIPNIVTDSVLFKIIFKYELITNPFVRIDR